MNPSSLRQQIQDALWERFQQVTGHDIDGKGYVRSVEQNLVPGVCLEMFQNDLEQGSGNELEGKFKAVHSSSALAVNSFSPFTVSPEQLSLANVTGFEKVQFERQCPTGLGGTPPNLDVFAEKKDAVVAVESKFLEYLTPKEAKFAKSYTRENLPQAEDCWFELIDTLKDSSKQYLDAAQLVKHYLGLKNQPKFKDKKITLLYLYWEPENWQEFDVFVQHRKEAEAFKEGIQVSSVTFMHQNYLRLWEDWQKIGIMPQHISNLL